MTSSADKRSLRRNDFLLITAIALAVLILAAALSHSPAGDFVSVSVGGKVIASYPLSADIREDIVSGEDSEGHNLLVILDGRAYIESASCPDGICCEHRPIYRSGESIVCLPNGVVVTVFTLEDGVDVVV